MGATVINFLERKAALRSPPPPETLSGLTADYVNELLAKPFISFTDIKTLELRSDYDESFIMPLSHYLSGLAVGIEVEAEESQLLTPEQRDMYDCIPAAEALLFAKALEKLAERVAQTLAIGA